MTNLEKFSGNIKGGVAIRLAVMLLTLVLIGGTISVVLNRVKRDQEVFHRKALSISEYGLMMALQEISGNPSWSGGFQKTFYDDGYYIVTVLRDGSEDTLRVTLRSEGRMKSVSSIRTCVLRLNVLNGDSVWFRESLH